MMPKVSVIMGVYNSKNKKMLKQSIDSILNQSFLDFEFIICNDGSTDDTLNILNEYKEVDKRIMIISYSENQGLSYALNKCIEISTGEYIARQDDDDISAENRLEIEYSFLSNNEYSFVCSAADVFDSDGVWGKYDVIERPTKNSFLKRNPFIHPTLMCKRECLLKVNNYEEKKYANRCEDYDLFMKLYSHNFIGYNIQESLYSYYIERNRVNYRNFNNRVCEFKTRVIGYTRMKLFYGYFFAFIPLFIALINGSFLRKYTRKKFEK